MVGKVLYNEYGNRVKGQRGYWYKTKSSVNIKALGNTNSFLASNTRQMRLELPQQDNLNCVKVVLGLITRRTNAQQIIYGLVQIVRGHHFDKLCPSPKGKSQGTVNTHQTLIIQHN